MPATHVNADLYLQGFGLAGCHFLCDKCFVLFVAHRLGGCFIVCLAVTIPVNIPDFTGVPLSDAGSLSPAWVYVLSPSQETEMDVSGAVSPLLNCSSVGRP